MKAELLSKFLNKWDKYFSGAELPIGFYYTNDDGKTQQVKQPKSSHCIFSDIVSVRKGRDIYFDLDNIKCNGAKRYFGFRKDIRPNFRYFLSCGIEGELEGERYKRSPELVDHLMNDMEFIEAPGKYIVFKRIDKFHENEIPAALIFFASGDVLSGLFTLANYDQHDPYGVIAPFCSGCSAIVYYPLVESRKENPKAILGTFDVSARSYVKQNELSFAIPYKKFERIVNYADESFLVTDSWQKIRKRIENGVKSKWLNNLRGNRRQ